MSRDMTGEEKQLLEALKMCFEQACYYDGKYDHTYLCAYENAQDILIRYGAIEAKDCSRVL